MRRKVRQEEQERGGTHSPALVLFCFALLWLRARGRGRCRGLGLHEVCNVSGSQGQKLLLVSNEELSVAKAELKSQQETFENEMATLTHKLSLAEQQVRFLFAMLS
jgi:hypothetical protein